MELKKVYEKLDLDDITMTIDGADNEFISKVIDKFSFLIMKGKTVKNIRPKKINGFLNKDEGGYKQNRKRTTLSIVMNNGNIIVGTLSNGNVAISIDDEILYDVDRKDFTDGKLVDKLSDEYVKYLKSKNYQVRIKINESLSEPELNRILDKINKNGMSSLSNHEKTLLKSYSDKNIDVDEEKKKQQKKQKSVMNVISNQVTHLKVEEGEYEDLENNIGRYIRFKGTENMKIGDEGWGYMGIFEIVGLQKHWGHNEEGKYVPDRIGYRVAKVGVENDFGKPCSVEEAEFVDISEEEAMKINKKLDLETDNFFKKRR